jgi:hypothetical protein
MEPPNVIIMPIPNLKRTIESFDETDCWSFFETRKEDLYRLLKVFRLPTLCIFDNRISMPGEEVLLRGLYELCSGAEQHDMTTVFGRLGDGSAQSRAFSYFIDPVNFLEMYMKYEE